MEPPSAKQDTKHSSRIAIITVGARGIGAATARRLAADGYAVCVNLKEYAERANALVAEIEAFDRRAIAARADASVEADVLRLFWETDARLGPSDALVNNVGVIGTQSRIDETEADDLAMLLQTNVTGPAFCCREAVQRMSHRHGGAGGAIVKVSSMAAQLGGFSR